jgi:hypothetical protein
VRLRNSAIGSAASTMAGWVCTARASAAAKVPPMHEHVDEVHSPNLLRADRVADTGHADLVGAGTHRERPAGRGQLELSARIGYRWLSRADHTCGERLVRRVHMPEQVRHIPASTGRGAGQVGGVEHRHVVAEEGERGGVKLMSRVRLPACVLNRMARRDHGSAATPAAVSR